MEVVDPFLEESLPVVRGDLVQILQHIVEGVLVGDEAAVVDCEELPGEVVEGRLVVRELTNLGVRIQPDQLAFGVIVLGPLIADPAYRPPLGDGGLVCGIDERAPIPSGTRGEVCGRPGRRGRASAAAYAYQPAR